MRNLTGSIFALNLAFKLKASPSVRKPSLRGEARPTATRRPQQSIKQTTATSEGKRWEHPRVRRVGERILDFPEGCVCGRRRGGRGRREIGRGGARSGNGRGEGRGHHAGPQLSMVDTHCARLWPPHPVRTLRLHHHTPPIPLSRRKSRKRLDHRLLCGSRLQLGLQPAGGDVLSLADGSNEPFLERVG